MNPHYQQVRTIGPPHGWQLLDLKEFFEYRDLVKFLVWRDIKVLYAQTILGFGWAILAPLVQIVLFTVIFGKVAKLPTDGVPYFLYSTLAIIPWTYMSGALSSSASSLVSGQAMLGKVYFPRLIYPLVPVISKLVDFTISLTIIVAVMIYYGIWPGWNLLLLPVFLVMMMIVPAAIGTWLSALAIRYRDVNFSMQYIMKLLIYSAPILYSASSIPDTYRFLYSLNPVVGVIEGFRAMLLGDSIPWLFVLPGFFTGCLMLVTGMLYFKRMERVFADVI